ncbi:hypothetical protein PTI98_007241 [Pleurotus ostreatus]|nr:hypothetical protein PTI98_007241 [Pleurotus ostreatus]
MLSPFSDIRDAPHSSPRQSNNFPRHGVGDTETLLPISNFHRRFDPQLTQTVSRSGDDCSPLQTASHTRDTRAMGHGHTDKQTNTVKPKGQHLPVIHGCELSSSSQPPIHQDIKHTSNSNTKVTDLVRRRCFNCSATQASAWRRSIINPGKILCNKCGLRERVCRKKVDMPRPATTSTASLQEPHRYSHGRSPYGHIYLSSSSNMDERRQRYSHTSPDHHSLGISSQMAVPFADQLASHTEEALKQQSIPPEYLNQALTHYE